MKKKRLLRLSEIDVQKLEKEYQRMIINNGKENVQTTKRLHSLPENKNDDVTTLLLNPMLVEYENSELNTAPHPGMQGWWAASLRWLGR